MKTIIETERLILREFSVDDAEVMYQLNSDPEVIQYTGDAHFESVADARALLAAYDQYEKYNMGRWMAIRKSDQAIIGWCGLKYLKEVDEVDVGYRFFKQFWGLGYATESAKASMEYGFNTLDLKRIVAHAMVENKASERIIQKLGMRFIGHGLDDGHAIVLYEMNKEDFTISKSC